MASSASGQAYMEKRDYDSAIAPLKHALELDKDSAPAHQLLGYACSCRAMRQRRFRTCNFRTDKTALGIAQIQTGQLPEAVANLQAAQQRTPTIRISLLPGPRQRFALEAID
jgi:Flp pilus assembly protein TadD